MKKTYRASSSDGPRGGKKFGKENFWERGSGGRSAAATTLFKATCGECRKPCEVPFKPTGSRPVLCGECFKRDGAGANRFDATDRPRRSNFGEKRNFRQEPSRYAGKDSGDNAGQFRIINAKLDAILKALT